ncbi:hypothetical protein GCM10009562_17150 [Nocardioides aquaticus]
MSWTAMVTAVLLATEYVLKLAAVGTVPEGRRPASSSAWLLLILFVPVVGFPLYWMIGSPWVRGRRIEVQRQATGFIGEQTRTLPTVPWGAEPSPGLASILRMNRHLTGIPCVTGADEGLFGDTAETFAAMTGAVADARCYVQVEFYIASWDEATDAFFTALCAAAGRGVEVRMLMDHLGSRSYPGWKELQRRLTAAGVAWELMMPIRPLRRQWRRPDLRNHRKLLVVDGETAFVGSHNLIGPAYGSARNAREGRRWKDLTLQVSGDVVLSVEAVFATDWYTETGQVLDFETHFVDKPDLLPGDLDGRANAMQVVASGPGSPASRTCACSPRWCTWPPSTSRSPAPTSCRTRRCCRRSPPRPIAGSGWSCSWARRPTSSWSGTPSGPTTAACSRPGWSSTSTRRRRCCTRSTSPSTTRSG